MNKLLLLLVGCVTVLFSCTKEKKEKMTTPIVTYPVKFDSMPDGIYTIMNTTKGEIILNLNFKETPLTVCNFIGLAEGKIKNSAKAEGVPYYDGLTFHRVIKNFMIQGGCPIGDGTGDPGYKFKDEFVSTLKHNAAGVLSMANAGPTTNGSQFFITHKATTWLDGKHTVFGNVVVGMNVVNAIEQGDKIINLTVVRKGVEANDFKSDNATFITLK